MAENRWLGGDIGEAIQRLIGQGTRGQGVGGQEQQGIGGAMGMLGNIGQQYPLSYSPGSEGGLGFTNAPIMQQKQLEQLRKQYPQLRPKITPKGTEWAVPNIDPISLMIYKQIDPEGYERFFGNKTGASAPTPPGFVEDN